MSWRCGIIGLPNAGKTTIFNALTAGAAEVAPYPFCTITPNTGVVPVPDPRLARWAELLKPQRLTPATIEFVDVAGLIEGASRGEGLGNQFLASIREVDLLVHVVRCFGDESSPHPLGVLNPVRDVEVVETELLLGRSGDPGPAAPQGGETGPGRRQGRGPNPPHPDQGGGRPQPRHLGPGP